MKDHTRKCIRCGGKGRLEVFSHKDNGRCFACAGTGRIEVRKRTTLQDHIEEINARLASGWDNIKSQAA